MCPQGRNSTHGATSPGGPFEKGVFVPSRRPCSSLSSPTVSRARIRDIPAASRLPAILRGRWPARTPQQRAGAGRRAGLAAAHNAFRKGDIARRTRRGRQPARRRWAGAPEEVPARWRRTAECGADRRGYGGSGRLERSDAAARPGRTVRGRNRVRGAVTRHDGRRISSTSMPAASLQYLNLRHMPIGSSRNAVASEASAARRLPCGSSYRASQRCTLA